MVEGAKFMPWIILVIGMLVWFVVGDPPRTVADWFWEYSPAPWERVDALYFPNRNTLTVYEMETDVGSIDNCRAWAKIVADIKGDPNFLRSSYECGIGKPDIEASLPVYRAIVF